MSPPTVMALCYHKANSIEVEQLFHSSDDPVSNLDLENSQQKLYQHSYAEDLKSLEP